MGKGRCFVSVFAFFMILILSGFVCMSARSATADTRGIDVVFHGPGSGSKAGAGSVPLYDRMTAVVIGVDRYQNLLAKDFLKYAVRDAKGVASVLNKHYPFKKVITLYNEQATRDMIIKVLQGDLSRTGPEDAVLIYFAGHGITRSTAQGDLGYLVPYDGSLKMDEMYKNISMQQIKADVCPLIPAKHVLIVADACFGGLLLATRSIGIEPSHKTAYLREITREPVRQIITAGSKDQEVLDGGIGGHSVFTGRLIAALEDVQDFISTRELGLRLQQQVYGDAAARGHTQKPMVGEIYGTGDFVFVPDTAKRQAQAEDQVDKIESELAELERLKKSAVVRKEEARLRELERQRLLKEAALKHAKIREEAALQEAELQQKARDDAFRDAEKQKRREKERRERLAYLKLQAEKLRMEVGSPAKAMGLKEAAAEVKKINAAVSALEADFKTELERQLQPVREYYRPKLAEAENIPPRDTMFETETDYKARVNQSTELIRKLQEELSQKEEGIKAQLETGLTAQKSPLLEQRKKIIEQEFPLGPGDVEFKLVNYDPEREVFSIYMNNKESRQEFSFAGILPVPKANAREYWQNPDLLVPGLVLSVDKHGMVRPRKAAFRRPEGKEYLVQDLEKSAEPIAQKTGERVQQNEVLRLYCAEIWARVQNHWVLPEQLLNKTGLTSIVVVRIAQDGKVLKARYENKSGHALFDQSAMRAVQKASPFPPLPLALRPGPLEIGIRFKPGEVGL
ncbi:MAG: TonB family protein [Proteobacteria bacterium]|nr:TonB family protein [Pseudomonadota bacterium]